MNVRLYILFFCSVFVAGTCHAQTLITALPKDGTSAKYEYCVEATIPTGAVGKNTTEIMLRSVGTVHENMEAYRWIELDFREKPGSKKSSLIYKFLVKESSAIKGEINLENIQKFYGAIELPNEKRLTDHKKQSQLPSTIRFLFPKELKDASPLEDTTVQTEIGDLRCKVIEATAESDMPANPRVHQTLAYKIYSNEQSPFGTTQLEFVQTRFKSGKQSVKTVHTFKLKEIGTGATSALPDVD
jgi:hypothetical protein